MLKKLFFGIIFIICFSLIFSFGTVYAKSEKAKEKEEKTEKVDKKAEKDDDDDEKSEKAEKDDDDDDEKGKKGEKGKKDDDDDDDDDKGKKDKDGKATICHYTGGDTGKGQTISVGKGAVDAHMKHGDAMGACSGDEAKGKSKDKGTKGSDTTTEEGEIEKKVKRWWELWKDNKEG